jgi:hypothetical protein
LNVAVHRWLIALITLRQADEITVKLLENQLLTSLLLVEKPFHFEFVQDILWFLSLWRLDINYLHHRQVPFFLEILGQRDLRSLRAVLD